MTRAFHLGDILSVTTERLVSPRHVEGIYDILNFMTGDNLFTHQLPRANEECKPALLRQHPQLADAEVPASFGTDPEQGVAAWLTEQVQRFGEALEVTPLAADEHTRIDGLDELAMMRGDDHSRIIAVVVEGEPPASRIIAVVVDGEPPASKEH